MFIVDLEHRYRWPVKIHKPMNGGVFETEEWEVTFIALDDDELQPLLSGSNSDRRLLRRVLQEVHTPIVIKKAGKEEQLPWSESLREVLIKIPYVRTGLVDAYIKSVSGAKAGN